MRTSRSLVLATLSAALAAGALVAAVHAQADPINPPVANCNTTPDIVKGSSPPQATPVTPALLTSGHAPPQSLLLRERARAWF